MNLVEKIEQAIAQAETPTDKAWAALAVMQHHNHLSRLQPSGDGEKACRNCSGCGWVCEDHRDTPWAGLVAGPKCCGGAGAPCPVCNPEMACAGYIESARTDGYAKAIEDAARVADARRELTYDGEDMTGSYSLNNACRQIAKAIRALAGKDATQGDEK